MNWNSPERGIAMVMGKQVVARLAFFLAIGLAAEAAAEADSTTRALAVVDSTIPRRADKRATFPSTRQREGRPAVRGAVRRAGNATCDSLVAWIHVVDSTLAPNATGQAAPPSAYACLMEFAGSGPRGRGFGWSFRDSLEKRGWLEIKERFVDEPAGIRLVMRRDSSVIEVAGGWGSSGEKETLATYWIVAVSDTAASGAASRPERVSDKIVVAPPTDGPAFGEYVYVEELPEAITKTMPNYPADARAARVEGTVMIQALVGRDGQVKDTRVVKSIPMLDLAAVDCVRQWKFKPALAKGQPVAVWVAVPVRFTLH